MLELKSQKTQKACHESQKAGVHSPTVLFASLSIIPVDMDKKAIIEYAVWARRELIERISQRAMIYGISVKTLGI